MRIAGFISYLVLHSKKRAGVVAGVWMLSCVGFFSHGAPAGQRFYPDDPVMRDPDDTVPVTSVAAADLSESYAFFRNTIADGTEIRNSIRAANINTLDEVPDSSWFQNRHARRRMTAEELERGPDSSDGPSLDGPWTVIEGKAEGASPGLRIRDAQGTVYLLKLDTAEYPEMASSAEIISTKFFYAAGYHVPENYLVYFKPDRLMLDGTAKTETPSGRKRRMYPSDVEKILAASYKYPDGRYRAVASRFLKGTPVGPFQYSGTRPGDPNDIFDHQHRRELRGLRVIASWLNHDDIRASNTLDMLVDANGRRYVRHYLIDFGSTLGSGTTKPTDPKTGHEYMLEVEASLKRLASLGLWQPDWTRISYPDFRGIGRFEADHFHPGGWKPEYPNRAFQNMRLDDAYWGARIVMSFSDEDIRTIVRTGGLTDRAAEEYLAQTLIRRRDKIGSHWLTQVNSSDRFSISSGGSLTFEYLAAAYGFVPPPEAYTVRWFEYDNEREARNPFGSSAVLHSESIPIPAQFTAPGFHGYCGVEIAEARGTVVVFLRKTSPDTLEIVGIERGQ